MHVQKGKVDSFLRWKEQEMFLFREKEKYRGEDWGAERGEWGKQGLQGRWATVWSRRGARAWEWPGWESVRA